jgi:hypothetical protein
MKRALKTAAFLILLAGAYWYVDGVLNLKSYDGIERITHFYQRKKQDIDVFFVGSSQACWDIDPVTVWKEAGIPSYDLGGPNQPFWTSYFHIKEGLKYQKPKVIVLDVYAACFAFEYTGWVDIVQNNIGLKPSKEKIESIFVSSPDRRRHIFLGFPVYHTRYSELTKRDFVDPYEGGVAYRNGVYLKNSVSPQPRPDVTNVTTMRELPPKSMEYLLKIIELAKNQHIKLLLVKSPFVLSPEQQEYFNSVAGIAENNDLRFINYNLLYDELDFDFTTDMADKWHLSYPGGVVKYSRHLAALLADEYGLTNHRNDPAYEDWNIWAERIGGDTENTESL